MYRPGTGYTALYSCFNNWLQSVPTRYRLHSLCTTYPTPNWLQSHPTPVHSTVLILGQVDSKYLQIWLQLTGYRVFKSPDQFTGYTALFSPKLVTEPADKVPAIQPCFTKTGYRVYAPSPFNSSGRCGSIYKNYRLVTECTDQVPG